MCNTTVKKIVARYNKREFITCSLEEMNQFIANGIRPDFEDKEILCVKFIVSLDDGNSKSSSWFINPAHIEGFTTYTRNTILSPELIYAPNTTSGPKMSSNFLPEILVLQRKHPHLFMLKEYQKFYSELSLLKDDVPFITFETKLKLFLQYIEYARYGRSLNVVLAYYKMQQN